MTPGGSLARPDGEGRRIVLAATIYLAVTVFLAYPLALNPASSAMPGDPDTDLFMWTLAWNTHAILSQPFSIFDSNIYYPHERTLAFSENLLGSTPFAAPVLWLGGSPLLALNIVALSSVMLSGIGGYLLGRRVGLGPAAAFVCGMVCAFAPARFFRLGQLHLTSIQWIPFSLAFLHAYLDTGRRRDLLLAIAFFSLQALASGHGAVFLTFAILVVLVYRFAFGEPWRPLERLRDVGAAGALLFLPALLIFIPYRIVQTEFGLRRTLADWETTPQSFISSVTPLHVSAMTALFGPDFGQGASAHLFPGFLVVVLAAATLLAPIRSWRVPQVMPTGWTVAAGILTAGALVALGLAAYVSIAGPVRTRVWGILFSAREPLRLWIIAAVLLAVRLALVRRVPFAFSGRWNRIRNMADRTLPRWRTSTAGLYAVITLLSILLSAGPPLGLWPYVHELPGLNFIRVPSRFMLLGTISLAVLAAVAVQRLADRTRRPALIAAVVSVIIVAECYTIPLPGYREYGVRIPAADRWLATQPGPLVIAEVPANHFDDRLQSTYMVHSMAHWQKTVHGHSGLRTPLHVALYAKLRRFPTDESLEALRQLGVTHLVVHREMYEPDDWARLESELPAFAPYLHPVFDDGTDRVYALAHQRANR